MATLKAASAETVSLRTSDDDDVLGKFPFAAPSIDIVICFHNEEDTIELLFDRLRAVLRECAISWRVICVNDGSTDRTLELLMRQHEHDSRVKIIDLSRNFGKEQALTAGLDACDADAVVCMDADLQDPPETIKDFIQYWRQGYEVVYGVRARRDRDTLLKRATADLFYRAFNLLSNSSIPRNVGDFRLLDRKAVIALRQLQERNRFMKGLFNWVGFSRIGVDYHREMRVAGKTKWNYWRLWNFALDGITSFTTLPLRVWVYVGVITALAAFVYASFLVVRTLILGVDVPGYASLMVAVLFMGGIQLLSLGILGEYVGRLYNEAKGRPLYLVRHRIGF
jgi:polyisoprenyl-phosphate glycosyltransferase